MLSLVTGQVTTNIALYAYLRFGSQGLEEGTVAEFRPLGGLPELYIALRTHYGAAGRLAPALHLPDGGSNRWDRLHEVCCLGSQ